MPFGAVLERRLHDIEWLKERHDWPGLNGVVMVESAREIGDKIERETRFYITSLAWLACQLGPVVRSHWAIENSLHWVMDMIFRDDECRIRTEHAPPTSPPSSTWPTISSARLPASQASAPNAKSPPGTTISSQVSWQHDFFTRFPCFKKAAKKDARWFESHPHRKWYARPFVHGEDGGRLEPLPDGMHAYTAVQRLQDGFMHRFLASALPLSPDMFDDFDLYRWFVNWTRAPAYKKFWWLWVWEDTPLGKQIEASPYCHLALLSVQVSNFSRSSLLRGFP